MQLAAFTTTIYLHRGLAHRALRFPLAVNFVFRAMIWLLTGIVPREWVAVHRKHHHFTDVPGDPHSPVLMGFWKVQLGNFIFYRREARKQAIVDRFAPDLAPDRWDRWIFDQSLFGPVLTATLLVPFLGLEGAVLAVASMIAAYGLAGAGVNALGHAVGYKNFPNTATNLRVLALLTAGEGLHNNHHARPGTAQFAVRRGELDPGWLLIRSLEQAGCITGVKTRRPEPHESSPVEERVERIP
jgi:stearoyl-CoA desaturase (delta-9 desaturase)